MTVATRKRQAQGLKVFADNVEITRAATELAGKTQPDIRRRVD